MQKDSFKNAARKKDGKAQKPLRQKPWIQKETPGIDFKSRKKAQNAKKSNQIKKDMDRWLDKTFAEKSKKAPSTHRKKVNLIKDNNKNWMNQKPKGITTIRPPKRKRSRLNKNKPDKNGFIFQETLDLVDKVTSRSNSNNNSGLSFMISTLLRRQRENNKVEVKRTYQRITDLLAKGAIPTQEDIKRIIENDVFNVAQLFFKQGAFIEDFANIDTDQILNRRSSIFDLISRWEHAQNAVDHGYKMPYVLGKDITCVQDIKDIISPFVTQEDMTPAFKTDQDLYWQAARAGQFAQLIDMYKKEKARFPIEKLIEKDDTGLSLVDVLSFKNEADIWKSVLDPHLWQGHKKELKQFFKKYVPLNVQHQFDLENLFLKIDQYMLSSSSQPKKRFKRRQP